MQNPFFAFGLQNLVVGSSRPQGLGFLTPNVEGEGKEKRLSVARPGSDTHHFVHTHGLALVMDSPLQGGQG